ncbi:MAG: hypothetical protein HY548_02970 [Elusimicrobia bacterium]|nr:hypothetical protein [Elusimicrobiota bacterium]
MILTKSIVDNMRERGCSDKEIAFAVHHLTEWGNCVLHPIIYQEKKAEACEQISTEREICAGGSNGFITRLFNAKNPGGADRGQSVE